MEKAKAPERTMVEVDKETRRLLRIAALKRDLTMKELLRLLAARIDEVLPTKPDNEA